MGTIYIIGPIMLTTYLEGNKHRKWYRDHVESTAVVLFGIDPRAV